jgi:hypothetical protein
MEGNTKERRTTKEICFIYLLTINHAKGIAREVPEHYQAKRT